MTEPDTQPQHTRLRSEMERLTSEYALPVEPEAPVYKPEPLFNKGRMVMWAAITLGIWLAIKLVIPVVVESTKVAIRESIKDAQTTTGPDGKVIIRRDGRVITIKTDPTTIVIPVPIGASSAPPAAKATGATPATAQPRR